MRNHRTNSLSIDKIKTVRELRKITARLKQKGKKIAFTNGCFDILHYGHVQYLENASSKADVLVVGLNKDSSIKRIKGINRPIVNEKDRARVLAALESVDFVVLFGEDTPLNLIREIKPDLLIKGADWQKCKIIGADFVSKYGGKVTTVKFAQGYSTTNLIKNIAQKFCKE